MKVRANAVRWVLVLALAVGISACADPIASQPRDFGERALGKIELTLDGARLPDGAAQTAGVGDLISSSLSTLAPKTVDPADCRAWHVARNLVEEGDTSPDDKIVFLGALAVPRDGGSSTFVLARGRVFADSDTASAFVERLSLAANTCESGYTYDGPEGASSVRDVAVTSDSKHRGARVLAVEEISVDDASGRFARRVDNQHVFIAVGNVVVALSSPSGSDGLVQVTAKQWQSLTNQVVLGLESQPDRAGDETNPKPDEVEPTPAP